MLRRSAPAAAVLAFALTAGACSDPAPTAGPSPDDTVREIRAAREAVEEPAVDLLVAAQRLVAAVEALRTSDVEDPTQRLSLLADPPSEPFEELQGAIAAARRVRLAGDASGVLAAQEALDAAADAGRAVLEAARRDIANQVRAAEIHATLLGMTERWEQPGSRSQQLDRFADLAAEAESFAEILDAAAPVAPCLTVFERRAAAARHVAEATRQLHGHVEAYRGGEFDRLRAELAEHPFGLERPLVEGDLAELDCWRGEAPVVEAAADVEEALVGVEAALNPQQPSPSPSPGPSAGP